jgi:hypothetical protein
VASDYEDAALACLMRHCFGRSSELAFMHKQHVTMSADDVFYIRMLRVKTSEEQGLTLVLDRDDFLICPVFTFAVALVMYETPWTSLLSPPPRLRQQSCFSGFHCSTGCSQRLRRVLVKLLHRRSPQPAPRTQSRGEYGVQAYVNRLLKSVADTAGATSNLTSHSRS